MNWYNLKTNFDRHFKRGIYNIDKDKLCKSPYYKFLYDKGYEPMSTHAMSWWNKKLDMFVLWDTSSYVEVIDTYGKQRGWTNDTFLYDDSKVNHLIDLVERCEEELFPKDED